MPLAAWFKTPVVAFVMCLTFLAILASSADAQKFTLERNTDRPGADIDRIELGPGDARTQCEQACKENDFCQAYTWARGAKPNDPSVCWLKASVPTSKASDCCVSGVKEEAPAFSGSYELQTDLTGSDYARMEMPGTDFKPCRAACARDENCAAYTFVAPGEQGAKAVCYLKDAVPKRVVKSDCCVSGVKSWGFTVFGFKRDTDYPGNDIVDFPVGTGGRSVCEKACQGDKDCKSYTYVKSTATFPEGRCWIKERSFLGKDTNCCDSAKKHPGRQFMATAKVGFDLPGDDYHKIFLDTPEKDQTDLVDMCANACGADGKCKGYTYVKPGVQGPLPVCYMKARVPKGRNDECCVSATKLPEHVVKPLPPGAAPSILYFSANDPKRVIEGLSFPADMPDVRMPSGFENCSDKERGEIRQAWALAHHNTWRAHQIMQHIYRRDSERKQLWVNGFVDQMIANDDWANWSPRGWFGPFDNKRFWMSRRAIAKVFSERFKGKTFKVQCRGFDDGDGWHPCATARSREPMANHIVYGKINFCASFFEITTSLNKRAQNVAHEIFHWLKIPDSAYWVTDSHDHWSRCFKYHAVKALYGDDAAKLAFVGGCRDWNHNRAVRVNDNYAWFITMVGSRIHAGAMRSFPAEDYR